LIRSMTGFAERRFDSEYLSVKITIRSLNHRYFDWIFRGNQVREVENRLRTLCQSRIHRGRIEAFLDMDQYDPEKWDIRINEGLLEKILSSLDRVSTKVKDISFSAENLFSIPHLVDIREKKFSGEERIFLEKCFMDTLEDMIAERIREGKKLRKEIQKHVRTIKRTLARVEKAGRKQPALIRKKLRERLAELDHASPVPEDKWIQEVAFLAQRYDLTEEIARLKSHLKYMDELLSDEKPDPVGRQLDFLAQEIYREANTINSKAQDIEIIRDTLSIKSEVESIRQQVQNIE